MKNVLIIIGIIAAMLGIYAGYIVYKRKKEREVLGGLTMNEFITQGKAWFEEFYKKNQKEWMTEPNSPQLAALVKKADEAGITLGSQVDIDVEWYWQNTSDTPMSKDWMKYRFEEWAKVKGIDVTNPMAVEAMNKV